MSDTQKETEDMRANPEVMGRTELMRKYRAFIESLENRRAA
jgi:hypothetical protein